MPVKTWNDFAWCELTNCVINASGEVLVDDPANAGEITSPVFNCTERIYKLGNLKYDSESDVSINYRTYKNGEWSDWINADTPVKYMEYTLALTPYHIVTEYDIGFVYNIYAEEDYRYGILWSGRTDKGCINLARVDYDDSDITNYALNASFKQNYVYLQDEVSTNVIISYIPKDYVIMDDAQYVQWKVVLNSSDAKLREVELSYRLDFAYNISDQFPLFYRRV